MALSEENTTTTQPSFILVVTLEVDETRIDEFLTMMEAGVEATRKEPGCLRFDVLRDQEVSNKFVFYEAYKDAAAFAFHREQPAFQAWNSFQESKGVLSISAMKMKGTFFEL